MHRIFNQSFLDFSRGLLVFLILVLFWLSEIGQICILCIMDNGMLMYADNLQNWWDFGHGH